MVQARPPLAAPAASGHSNDGVCSPEHPPARRLFVSQQSQGRWLHCGQLFFSGLAPVTLRSSINIEHTFSISQGYSNNTNTVCIESITSALNICQDQTFQFS